MPFISRMRRALLPLGSLVVLLTACSDDTMSPAGEVDPVLQAQMAANQAAMAKARAHSAAVYDSLLQVWNRRGESRDGMMSSTDPFVACAPLPFDGEARIVTAAGGTFAFGPHRLTVQPGALSAPAAIAVIVETGLKTEVTLLPHGTQFAVLVKLTLAYAHCDQSPTHRVAYIDLLDNILEWPTSEDRPEVREVDTWLSHFSKYAIAY